MSENNTAYELVMFLKDKQIKASTAESLTGGLVSGLITDISGASQVFECGVCSYSNRVKHEVLEVTEQTLEQYTEYSPECAKEMAEGIRRLSGAELGISTTGIAGPAGGTDEKPVGTVYVGISIKNDTRAYELRLGSELSRTQIRELSAAKALSLALERLREEYGNG